MKNRNIIVLVSIGSSIIIPLVASAQIKRPNPFGTGQVWEETRVHCVWKTNKWGIKYRSCGPQYRNCQQANPPGKPRPPQTCGDWENYK
jgi:hypothetical protein